MSSSFLDEFKGFRENENEKNKSSSTNLQKVFESQKRLEDNSCKTILFSSVFLNIYYYKKKKNLFFLFC